MEEEVMALKPSLIPLEFGAGLLLARDPGPKNIRRCVCRNGGKVKRS
jgi:hypothetical protein